MSSRPLHLPGRHLINGSLLATNLAGMAAFVVTAPAVPLVAAAYLGANTVLSFIKGFTTTAAIGGADMRKFALSVHRILHVIDDVLSCRNHCLERVLWLCTSCRG